MIVRMKHLDLVCIASAREATLERLRALGVLHLDLGAGAGEAVAAAVAKLSDAMTAVRLIQKARGGADDLEIRPLPVEAVLALAEDRARLEEERDRLGREIRRYEPYGDFDPALARKLLEKGIDLKGELPDPLPEMRLSKLKEKFGRVENRIAIDTVKLAQVDDREIIRRHPNLRDGIAFEQAKALLAEKGAVAVLSGWVPEPAVAALRAAAGDSGWGVLLREPAAGEVPPTLVEPPRFFKSMKALFSGLGVSPAYVESDVSVPFMCYFSLFFAMLVGDGAYGAIFLTVTLALRRKLPRSWLTLLTVFSSATVLWGILSNTWFGASLPFLAALPTVAWLADPSYNNMMLLCFTIGASHLMLARLWNAACKLNDSTALAELGWAGVILTMYLVTNSIVGIFAGFPGWGLWLGGVSIALVFLFSVKPSELKTRGAELGMLPLNIMSALGDVISYVRLFAVGLASVKVAENFNGMATGLLSGADGWWVKALLSAAMVLILVFGHLLNLMMAGLSILVHAVRLNTLEFSNHKGVSWSGYAFQPFKKEK